MKKILLFLMLLLVACAPAAPISQGKLAPVQPTVTTNEEVTSPPQQLPPKTTVPVEEVTGTPMAPTGAPIDPYSQLGCEKLLTADEFASACEKSADDFQVTHKIGTKNCYVNAKSVSDNRLTAGVSLTGFADATTAAVEFQRRLAVLKVGADKSVGERAYTFPKVDRQSINFLRGKFIIEVGADTRLCPKEDLLSVARIVDNRLT